MRLSALLVVGFSLALMGVSSAAPLEAYGELPTLDDVTLSPDGSKLAYIAGDPAHNQGYIVVQPAAGGNPLAVVRTGDVKVRNILWIDEGRLVFMSSKTARALDVMGPRQEYYMAAVYDLASNRSYNMMDGIEAGKGMNVVASTPVIRMVDGRPLVFAQGIYFPENIGRLALFSIDPDLRRAKLVDAHSKNAREWYVDAAGNLVADEEFDDRAARWTMNFRQDGSWKEIYGENIGVEQPSVEGFSPDGSSIVVRYRTGGSKVVKAFSVKDASQAATDNLRASGTVISDRLTGRVTAYVYADHDVEYDFVDPKDEATWKKILAQFQNEQVDLVSASDDRTKVVVEVTGVNNGVSYFLIDTASGQRTLLGPAYAGIAETDVGDVRPITYPTSDGRPIDAFLTLPRGREAQKLPLVVMPHGGPAARDVPGFDWWAQALAAQGYAVLQPQFRGSDGYGWDLLSAGFGQWGKKMQTDLSDGVRALAKLGIVDPARVCIVGASYGGYAALAGATIDSGVYRCAASYGGISDLREMIGYDERQLGDGRLTDRYWLRFMGASSKDDPVLDQISPIRHIDKATIPILLVHGKDDTVVPIAQSEDMASALERIGKPVTFIKLDGEDHWLSRSATRLQMLKATVDFLKANNPP